ncbi:hypothetical protein PHPALM_31141, partial [Phytophthora palmivora]
MVERRETRSEKAAFAANMAAAHADDRARLLQEHRAFLEGKRDADADFASVRPAPKRAPKSIVLGHPPMGKDAAYLAHHKRFVSEQRRAIAAKTLAGSGKKKLKTPRKKVVDETWEPGDDEEEQEDEEDEADNDWEDADEVVSKKAKVPKVTAIQKVVNVPKMPRKKSAKTLAKEAKEAAEAVKRSAASKARQAQVSAAQREGKEAKEAARLRLVEKQAEKQKTREAK